MKHASRALIEVIFVWVALYVIVILLRAAGWF